MSLQREQPPLAARRIQTGVWLAILCLATIFPGLNPQQSFAAEPSIDDARKKFIAGDYAQTIRLATAGALENSRDEDWPELLVQALMVTGQYDKANRVLSNALDEATYSVRLRLLGHEVFRYGGNNRRADSMLEEINQLARVRDWAYRDPANRIAMGRAALLMGGEPKRVLELFFDPVKKQEPAFREAWLASGQLALAKNDFALAGRVFGDAAKRFKNDPEILLGLAQAFANSDTEAMFEAAQRALSINTNHVAARLLLADYQIDAEDYAQAHDLLDDALKINPAHPEAFALKAMLAHLNADAAAEKKFRNEALKLWTNNPAVDHTIGRKLSQKYRFAEGAEYQRRALAFDADYVPAKIQLAQDLLRLGKDAEGWKLAEQVNEEDPYDVVAYNLVTLKDSVAGFRELKSKHFRVRMAPKEADVYGKQVLALLDRAERELCQKYGLELKEPVIVEIFPDQKDFAIRTFGLPGGAGYLGVCFGSVITANSPATRPGTPANWEAILWHEFCHVVTLQLTRNRMPRWLSEGISVYEERQKNPAWGEHMTPTYRRMLLDDTLTPVSELSAAFLRPKSALHLQFAYYESSLAVEFLIERFGIEAFRKILADLATGKPINDAIAAHAAPMKQIDRDFAERARAVANGTGPGLDWSKPDPQTVRSDEAMTRWISENPTNFTALSQRASQLMEHQLWEEAKAPLKKLIQLYPDQRFEENAYVQLAEAHRRLGETAEERAVLEKIAAMSSDAPDAYARLMEIDAAAGAWATVLTNAQRFTAVNPLAADAHLQTALAQEKLGNTNGAIESLQTALLLNPADPAHVHYRLATQFRAANAGMAKLHTLLALEEAPRFQDALKLLVELKSVSLPSATNAPASASPKRINF